LKTPTLHENLTTDRGIARIAKIAENADIFSDLAHNPGRVDFANIGNPIRVQRGKGLLGGE
jgi:hypothetical protein